MGIEIIDPRSIPNWDRVLLDSGDFFFSHSSGWAAALAETYRFKPLYLVQFDTHGVSLVLPVMEVRSCFTGARGVSLPFTDRCEPFSRDDGLLPAARARALEHGRAAGWRFIEWRDAGVANSGCPAYETHLTHDISLEKSEEELFSELHATNRTSIRKAIRQGVTISIDRSMDSLVSFYQLNCLTRRRHGIPPQPFFFFTKVHQHILSKGLGVVASAVHADKVVAAAVFMLFGPHAMFKYGASDLLHQNLRPNNLLMWEAIKWLKRNGCTRLNLGRTAPDNVGLLRYKQAWGGTEASITYHRYCYRTEAFAAGPERPRSRGFKLLSKTPLPLLRMVGRLSYRHVG